MTIPGPVDISRQIFAIAEALAATPELISAYLQHHSQPLTITGIPGVDYAWSQPSIAALRSAGEVFVAQYFSNDPTKNLTPQRAHDLLAAGIKIVVVWEYGAQDARRGKTGGEVDAQNAETQARACGIDGCVFYWAIDYDAPPGDQALIDAYSDGWANVVGDDRGRNAYGGYWPLSRLRAAGKAARLWGTPAWSGTEWATSGLVPDIMQGAFVTIGGVQCDLDAAHGTDYGQWPRPSLSGPPYPHYFDGSTTLAQAAASRGMSLPRWLAEQVGLAKPNDLAVGLFAELGAFRPRTGIRYWSQNP